MYLIYIAVLSWCVAACPAAKAPKGVSKRIITFTKQEKCRDQGLGTWTCSSNFMMSKRIHLWNGNCTWPINIDENMKFRIMLSFFKDGQYNDGYFDIIIDGCQQFEQLSNDFFQDLFASSDIKSNQCPYPKGTYYYKNFHMEGKPLLPTTVPNGQYKLSISITDNKENLLGCNTFFVDIQPMENRKRNN